MGTLPDIEKETLALIYSFLLDIGNERAARALDTEASLDKDLGLGSIERVELLTKIETRFSIRLPERLIYEIDRVNELINAIQKAAQQSPISRTPRERLDIVESPIDVPTQAETLIEVLAYYARLSPERSHLYLQTERQNNGNEQIINYGELHRSAAMGARGLLELGLQPGDVVALMLPTDPDFFYAFFAVLLAGGIPAPIYPPVRANQIVDYTQRQAAILYNAHARFLIAHQQTAIIAGLLKPLIPSLTAVVTVSELMIGSGETPILSISQDHPALIQYTSGSTDKPKGVLLTHHNLLSNIRAIGEALTIKPKDVIVSWLPLYHDMGLIGAWLASLYFGIPAVIMSPFTFLTQPERWFWAIHYHRGSLSAAPNFAYELCLKKISKDKIEGLDLSSWRLALNGAEAINPNTVEQFSKRFSSYGFASQAMFPVYGLAEASVALAFPPINRAPYVDVIDRNVFESLHRAQPALAEAGNVLKFISCGSALSGFKVRLMDVNGTEILTERVVGHLQFQGDSVASGYFHSPEQTQAVFHDGWCDSGDFAYIANGEIFITGRKKDIIIKAGSNYYPEELERLTAEVEGVRKGCVAAFGVLDEELGTEKIVIVAEIKKSTVEEKEIMMQQITHKLLSQIGISPDEIRLVPPHTIPKTSSGKLRRSACRQQYQNNLLKKTNRSSLLGISKVFLSGIWPKIKLGCKKLLSLLYAAYACLIILTTLFPLCVFMRFNLKRTRLNRKLSHYWARMFTWMIACPVSVEGLEYLKSGKSVVLAPNHASYLDVIALGAAIPNEMVFVAKKELANNWFVGALMAGNNDILVDRTDLAKSELEVKEIKQRLLAGESVLIFPEATFTRAVGIRPFKLGAFKIAVESHTPVCPIAICGTRHILPSKRWTLRRKKIDIIITEPIEPISQDFSEIKRLRDETRERLIKLTGEPKLDLAAAGPL